MNDRQPGLDRHGAGLPKTDDGASSPGRTTGAPAAKRETPAERLFADHFQFMARYEGDQHTKKLATQAKSAATNIRRIKREFGSVLDPKEVAAIDAAARAMDELGAKATQASVLARRALEQQKADDERRRIEVADHVALKRWGPHSPDEAEPVKSSPFIDEVRDLIAFVDQGMLGAGSEEIMRLTGRRYLDFDIVGGVGWLGKVLEAFCQKPTPANFLALRRRAAEYIDGLGRGPSMHRVGLAEFERWREGRLEITRIKRLAQGQR